MSKQGKWEIGKIGENEEKQRFCSNQFSGWIFENFVVENTEFSWRRNSAGDGCIAWYRRNKFSLAVQRLERKFLEELGKNKGSGRIRFYCWNFGRLKATLNGDGDSCVAVVSRSNRQEIRCNRNEIRGKITRTLKSCFAPSGLISSVEVDYFLYRVGE